jgi:hypothetical protein
MPQDPSKPAECSGGPELPLFSDRLPDLIQSLHQAAEGLTHAPPKQSYIPYWEDLYAVAHGLKGVLKILSCPAGVAEAVTLLTGTLVEALSGDRVCRDGAKAAALFSRLALLLDAADLERATASGLRPPIDELESLYERDVPHEERLKEIPPHLFYVNEFVSKKAREITLLGLNHCVVEAEILLDEIPLWHTQLNEALRTPDGGRGLMVNFLPFLSPEGSRKLKVWAWVAAATHSRAALKQRIKEEMPSVALTKL